MEAHLSLTDDDGGYRLIKTDAQGAEAEMLLTEDDVMKLARSAQTLMDRILATRTPAGGSVSPVVATPVSAIRLTPDFYGTDLLLGLLDSAGTESVFALSLNAVQVLAEKLPDCLARMETQRPSRQ